MPVDRALLLVGAFIAAQVAVAAAATHGAWGLNALAYCAAPTRFLVVAAGLCVLTRGVRRGLVRTAGVADRWFRRPRGMVLAAVLAVSGVALFLGMRSAVHLLGDGYLRLRELEDPTFVTQLHRSNAPLAMWLVGKLSGSGVVPSAEAAFRLYSTVSGALYLLLATAMAAAMGRNGLERVVVLGMLVSGGGLQLFCGYVETYALVLPGVLLYLAAALREIHRPKPTWVPAVCLGVMIPLHLTLVTLLPSALALGAFRRSVEGTSHGWRTVAEGIANVAIACTVAAAALTAIGFSARDYVSAVKGTHILPLVSGGTFVYPYGLLSVSHMWDVLNLWVLVAPAAVMGLLLLRKSRRGAGVDARFLQIAAAFPLLFTLLANPEIGAFRDFDAFAFPGVVLSVWVASRLLGQGRVRAGVLGGALPVCCAALLHSLTFVGINAHEASAVIRFRDALDLGALSPQARSYGWETLAGYHRDRGDAQAAAGCYDRALKANPDNPRHWLFVGNHAFMSGRLHEAERAYEHALRLNPELPQTHVNLGVVYLKTGRLDRAVDTLERAVALGPDLVDAHSNLGNAHRVKGDEADAAEHYLRTLQLDPDHPAAPGIRAWLDARPGATAGRRGGSTTDHP